MTDDPEQMSRDARVLHLITRYLDGGAETTTRNTLAALAGEGYDLRLGTGAEHDPDELEAVADSGVDTTVFRTLRHYNPVAALLAVVQVARYLRREDIDILHTHSTEAGIVGRLAGSLAGTPVVIHEVHGDPIAADRHPVLNAFLLAAERACAPLADTIVVKSERIRETYLDRNIGRPQQYELIYHGVDISRFEAERQPTSSGPPMELLFVGRLADGKGLFDLLDAVERLDDVRLRIAGDGPVADELRDEVDGRDLSVELLGYRDDIPVLMARSDVLVLPSYREGTPRAITEAMAAGLPVVATDIAGIPEQVDEGETGYLIEPGDVDALTRRLRDLASDEAKRRRFGRRASERVERFAVETARKRYRELYRELGQR